jgi:hypothetical protein
LQLAFRAENNFGKSANTNCAADAPYCPFSKGLSVGYEPTGNIFDNNSLVIFASTRIDTTTILQKAPRILAG